MEIDWQWARWPAGVAHPGKQFAPSFSRGHQSVKSALRTIFDCIRCRVYVAVIAVTACWDRPGQSQEKLPLEKAGRPVESQGIVCQTFQSLTSSHLCRWHLYSLIRIIYLISSTKHFPPSVPALDVCLCITKAHYAGIRTSGFVRLYAFFEFGGAQPSLDGIKVLLLLRRNLSIR